VSWPLLFEYKLCQYLLSKRKKTNEKYKYKKREKKEKKEKKREKTK
jgi:hypothetical protein